MQDRLTAVNVCAQRPRGALPAPFCMTFWSCYGEAKPRYEHPLGADLKARWMAYCADFWKTPGIDYQLLTIGRNLNQPGQRAGFSFPSTSQPWPCHGWKQCQGRHRRPHAERSEASTERGTVTGAAFTLDADGGHRAYRQGDRTRAPPAAPAPADSRARTDAGCNRSGCPSEARSLPDGDRIARSREIRCHQKETPPKRG
jgi:hypothetical protein